MSVNMYLKKEVKELPGFTSKPYSDGSGEQPRLDTISLYSEKGRLYASWNEYGPVPEGLEDLVEEFSYYDSIPQMGYREAGIYRHESAECELIPETNSGKTLKKIYILKATAKNLEDLREIIRKVKTGTISPDESYEGPQGGLSRAELEFSLRESNFEVERQRETFADMQTLQKRLHAVYNLAVRLNGQWWPFCTKNNVYKKIVLAVNEGEKS